MGIDKNVFGIKLSDLLKAEIEKTGRLGSSARLISVTRKIKKEESNELLLQIHLFHIFHYYDYDALMYQCPMPNCKNIIEIDFYDDRITDCQGRIINLNCSIICYECMHMRNFNYVHTYKIPESIFEELGWDEKKNGL